MCWFRIMDSSDRGSDGFRNGIATAPYALASQSAAGVLQDGGNAIEAMIAAASAIAVVYPHMNSIGGDAFWLILQPARILRAKRGNALPDLRRAGRDWHGHRLCWRDRIDCEVVPGEARIFAADFGVSTATVFGLAALPLALTIDRFCNGLTRPMFGLISDRIGREKTMFIAFSLEAIAMTLWLTTHHDPTSFVLLSGVVFPGWGEIFSLFPATLTDTFADRYATANYGWLYISFGVGSVFGGPLAALLHQHTGSWIPVFGTAIALDVLTALLALFVLKPIRQRAVGKAPTLPQTPAQRSDAPASGA
jgi:hypothetical protein